MVQSLDGKFGLIVNAAGLRGTQNGPAEEAGPSQTLPKSRNGTGYFTLPANDSNGRQASFAIPV